MIMIPPRIAPFLPLTPRVFHILLAVSDTPRNGYQIMSAVESNSSARVRIGPGTLYEALHRLREQELLEEVEGPVDGRRQRFYDLTSLGRAVLRAEAARLAADVRVAHAQGALEERA